MLTRINANFNDCEKRFLKKKISATISHLSDHGDSYKQEMANINDQKTKFLQSKGWSNMEIQNFGIWMVANNKIKIAFIDVAIEFIIFKHRLYSLEFELNAKAKELLLKLVETKIISYYRKKMMLLEEAYNIDDGKIEEINSDEYKMAIFDECIDKLIEKTDPWIPFIQSNRFIISPLKDLLTSSMSIVGMDKEYLKSMLDYEERNLNRMSLNEPREYSEKRKQIIEFIINSLGSS